MYSNTNICFLPYEYIWYSYSVKLTWRIYIRCIFGMGLLDIRHIFGIYSNIRHRISIIRIQIFNFIGMNIFGIRIRSKSKLQIYSYSDSVQNLMFVLHCLGQCYACNKWICQTIQPYVIPYLVFKHTCRYCMYRSWADNKYNQPTRIKWA